jgi:hypothetical protein
MATRFSALLNKASAMAAPSVMGFAFRLKVGGAETVWRQVLAINNKPRPSPRFVRSNSRSLVSDYCDEPNPPVEGK